ncbi:MAG: HAD family hydrolase [Vulcanimicrobiota bacterium]
MNRLVVFDLDGVLINSEEANYQAFAHGLEQLGYRPERAAVIGLVGLPALTMLERLGCPPDRCLDIFEGFVKPYYLENLPEQTSAMEGAADVLAELKGRGYRIGSCTSGDLVTQRQALTSIGLWDFIEEIQTPCQSRYGKPDPRYLAELVERFGPSRVTHVEDSEVGLRMGRDFGARTVFARYGYGQLTVENPDHQIERLSDLLALL